MSFEKIAEQKIREAMEQGEFDDLPGAGKPLKDLDSYFATPEDVRVGYSVLKNSGFVPEEVEIKREIESLQSERRQATTAPEKTRLDAAIRHLQLKYDILLDSYRRRRSGR
jgi:hypothetical protein